MQFSNDLMLYIGFIDFIMEGKSWKIILIYFLLMNIKSIMKQNIFNKLKLKSYFMKRT